MANFILDAVRKNITNRLIKKQSTKTRAPGSAKFKPTNTSGSPARLMKGKKIYKPNQIGTPEPYAISNAHSSNTQKKGAKLKEAYKQDAKNKNLSPYTAQKRNPNAVPGKASTSNSKNKAPSYKTKTKKKQTTKTKSNKRVHYATEMAKKLMGGGTKRY